MRCLELYSGIGGFATAAQQLGWDVSLAIDINQRAEQVYRHNFEHRLEVRTIESVSVDLLASAEADFWWMSPPCQPFTRRGNQCDLADSRTESFLAVLNHVRELRPPALALENVCEFRSSAAASVLRDVLSQAGYRWCETEICPTQLGIPNQRRRFYLVACQTREPELFPVSQNKLTLSSMLDERPSNDLLLDSRVVSAYRESLHCVGADVPHAVTSCFTSAYGKSHVRSGSYLTTETGLRRFLPQEILRLLGFPGWFELPIEIGQRTGWKLVGNSLSIPVVIHVLRSVCEGRQVAA